MLLFLMKLLRRPDFQPNACLQCSDKTLQEFIFGHGAAWKDEDGCFIRKTSTSQPPPRPAAVELLHCVGKVEIVGIHVLEFANSEVIWGIGDCGIGQRQDSVPREYMLQRAELLIRRIDLSKGRALGLLAHFAFWRKWQVRLSRQRLGDRRCAVFDSTTATTIGIREIHLKERYPQ